MELVLFKNKVTKNNKVRFGDDANHELYLSPEENQELGSPKAIQVKVEAMTVGS